MIAILTFGKFRADYPEPPDNFTNPGRYINRIQPLIIPNYFSIAKCQLDYYGVKNENSKANVVAEVIECKEVFFRYLYNQYTRFDFSLEVFELASRFPMLHKKYPQGLIYFTRNNALERTCIEDASKYEKERINRLTNPYYDRELDYDKVPQD